MLMKQKNSKVGTESVSVVSNLVSKKIVNGKDKNNPTLIWYKAGRKSSVSQVF